jgi:hypothetical protein
MDLATIKLRCRDLIGTLLLLSLTTEVHADELTRAHGDIRDASTQTSDKQPLPQPAASRKRWHINLDAASREAQATGRPMMIVFR